MIIIVVMILEWIDRNKDYAVKREFVSRIFKISGFKQNFFKVLILSCDFKYLELQKFLCWSSYSLNENQKPGLHCQLSQDVMTDVKSDATK